MKKIIIVILNLVIMFYFIGYKKPIYAFNEIEEENSVATITFYASDGSSERNFLLLNLGHAFFTILNETDDYLLVGDYRLEPLEQISISLWPISFQFGVWYNLESVMVNNNNKYKDRLSVSFKINKNTLSDITSYINQNPTWSFLYNCSKFTSKVYSIVTKNNLNYLIYSPSKLKSHFKNYNYQTYEFIKKNNNVGYFDGGKFISCEIKSF